MSIQFIACTADDCPLNENRQCRAPWIMIDEDGRCMIYDGGPYSGKAETERYVDLKECLCQACNHWEENEMDGSGQCGFHDDLFFKLLRVKDDNSPSTSTVDGPFCHEFDKQINKTPPFQTNV